MDIQETRENDLKVQDLTCLQDEFNDNLDKAVASLCLKVKGCIVVSTVQHLPSMPRVQGWIPQNCKSGEAKKKGRMEIAKSYTQVMISGRLNNEEIYCYL